MISKSQRESEKRRQIGFKHVLHSLRSTQAAVMCNRPEVQRSSWSSSSEQIENKQKKKATLTTTTKNKKNNNSSMMIVTEELDNKLDRLEIEQSNTSSKTKRSRSKRTRETEEEKEKENEKSSSVRLLSSACRINSKSNFDVFGCCLFELRFLFGSALMMPILIAVTLHLLLIPGVQAKGGAVIGGSAGGGQVCLECNPGGNYTQEEMRVALIILIIILCVFFALCSCQCYNRIKYECSDNTLYDQKNGCVPEAPYYRDSSQTNALTAAQSTSGGTGALGSVQHLDEAMLASLVKL